MNSASNELWLAADPWAQGVAGYRYREEPNGTLVEEPLIESADRVSLDHG